MRVVCHVVLLMLEPVSLFHLLMMVLDPLSVFSLMLKPGPYHQKFVSALMLLKLIRRQKLPSDHISNLEYNQSLKRSVDWEQLYQEKAIDLIRTRHRCSKYRQAIEYALEYLNEMGDNYHEALNITHLSEKSVWDKIKNKRNKGG